MLFAAVMEGGRERRAEEVDELGGVYEFGVRVRSGLDEPEDVLGGEDGEEVGEGRAGDCGEEEVAAGLRIEWVRAVSKGEGCKS